MLDNWLPFLIYGAFALLIPASMIFGSFALASRVRRSGKANRSPRTVWVNGMAAPGSCGGSVPAPAGPDTRRPGLGSVTTRRRPGGGTAAAGYTRVLA